MSQKRQPPSTRGCKFEPEVLAASEVQALLRACSRRGPSGIRNRALIVMLYRSGLRIQEALDLRPRDLNVDACMVHVRNGKGGKARRVGIDPQAVAVIEAWLVVRAELGAVPSQPLFCQITCGSVGMPVSQAFVGGMLKRLARRAGIERRVHAHAFRHTCASEMVAERLPLNVVQAQLGHTSLVVTQRYVARIAPHALAEQMREREWRLDG